MFHSNLGLKEYGAKLLSKFKWGHSFYEVNQELLDIYAECKNGAECVQKQVEFLKKEKEDKEKFSQTNGKLFKSQNKRGLFGTVLKIRTREVTKIQNSSESESVCMTNFIRYSNPIRFF
jgi:hypothetical protein